MSSSGNTYDFIDRALQNRKEEHRFRELNSYVSESEVLISDGNKEYVNFCGNDYLGLSKHPKVIERSTEYAEKYGAGATASRLINGTLPIHEKLERELAKTFGSESALLFNSGFQANSTIISTLTDRHSLILADKLSHNSLLQGSLASRADFWRFDHNSVQDLKKKLIKASNDNYSRIFVVTESLFSMDGDKSDLEAIADLCNTYGAWFFVDDAHAIGVYGEKGLGLAHEIKGIDFVLGTCGKAFGSFGAFLLCSKKVRNYLVNFCPGFIYTTALSPAVIGSIEASLELIPEMDEQREKVIENSRHMRSLLHNAGFSTGDSESHIIPIIIGGEEEALELAGHLRESGFLVTAIRPPTVPKGSARIRITLNSHHTKKHLESFVKVLEEWNG